MCGRYLRRSDKQHIAERFRLGGSLADLYLPDAHNNIAPSTFQPVIRHSRESAERELVLMRWGIVPWFAKREDEFAQLSTINAKADRLLTSNMWRAPFKSRRCLVPADGLYEWPKPGHAIAPTYQAQPAATQHDNPDSSAASGTLFDIGQPRPKRTARPKEVKRVFRITLAEEAAHPFAFAGIWDQWKRPDGTYLDSFSIVTTEPNELVATIHDRLALILQPRDFDRWLTTDDADPRLPIDLLRPIPSEQLVMFPADPRVGNVRNNDAELLNAPLHPA